MAERFKCQQCGAEFDLPAAARARYPGWRPKVCLRCRDTMRGTEKPARASAGSAAHPRGTARSVTSVENLTLAEVLARFSDGPSTGLFTDGSAQPNPGPGGWGAVVVMDGELVAQRHGHEPATTNNRMELTALIEGYRLVPVGAALEVYTDSQLCVRTMTEWAPQWAARGWQRKSGPIANLELVQELWAQVRSRPELKLRWTRGHAGWRWNEYADALSTAYTRSVL